MSTLLVTRPAYPTRTTVMTMTFVLLVLLCSDRTTASPMSTRSSSGIDDVLRSMPVDVTVARCRAQCLDKFTWVGWSPSDTLCREQPDCYMCWESCDLLNQNFVVWGAMCSRKDICFPGCQHACGFYVHGSVADESLRRADSVRMKFTTPIEFGVRPSTDSLTLRWSRPEVMSGSVAKDDSSNVVYVLLRRTRPPAASDVTTAKWTPVAQTCELASAVDAGSLPPASTVDFKLIVVTATGMAGQLVTSYRVTGALTMPRDGDKATIASLPPSSSSAGTATSISDARGRNSQRWTLHLMSLGPNRRLGSVDAVVTWASPGLAGNFLVTWEVKEGTFAITGHLYTDSTTVTLTLWPSTIYSVQVELVSETLEKATRSEPLTVDTNLVVIADESLSTDIRVPCDDTLIVAGTVVALLAAVVLVVGILALLARRCTRHDDAKMMSPAGATIRYNNNDQGGPRRVNAIRRRPSIITVNGPTDIEAVLSPRPPCYANPAASPSSDLSSSLDERLSAFRAFLDNVEKMAASTSPKTSNHQTSAFPLPISPEASFDSKPMNASRTYIPSSSSSDANRFLLDDSAAEVDDDDHVTTKCHQPFEVTPATKMLVKKNKKPPVRRCMSTAM